MADKIYINTERPASEAVVKSENRPTQPALLPSFVEGGVKDVELYLVTNAGTFDARSGDAGVAVKVSVGSRDATPKRGTFTLTDTGAAVTSAIDYGASAQTIEDALNALNGGAGSDSVLVDVTKQSDELYTVVNRTVGAATAISGASVDLSPESSVTPSISVTGDASTRAQQIIEIKRQPAIYTSTWATVTNGFSGTLSANNARVAQSIQANPNQPFIFEVSIDNDVVCQVPCEVKEAVTPPSAYPANDMPTALDEFAADPSSNASFDAAEWKSDLAVAAADITDATADGIALMTSADANPFTDADEALLDSATQPGDDADTLGSGAATDGQILTADGVGGAAWEDPTGGAGDMTKAVYDPTTVEGDAFDMDNMAESATKKILTDTERTKLAGIEESADVALPSRAAHKTFRAGSTASYLSIPDDPTVDVGTGDFSVFWWGKLPSTSNVESQFILRKISGADGFSVYYQGTSGGTYGVITTYVGGDSFGGLAADANDDKWHFFCLTFDRDTQITLYKDGVLADTNAISAATDESTSTVLSILGSDTGTKGANLAHFSNYIGLTKDLITASEIALLAKDPREALNLDNLAALVEVPSKNQFYDRSPNAATVSLSGSVSYEGYSTLEISSNVQAWDADLDTYAADPTAAVDAAGAVMESDFIPAFSLLVQQSGTGTPAPLTVAADTILGRVTGGASEIDDLTPAQVRTLLNVEDGATADQTGAEIKAAYELEANAYTDTKDTKLSGIETAADVTDETNVTAALDGATLTDVGTPASTDRILLQDASDSNNLKYADFSEFSGGGGGLSAATSAETIAATLDTVALTPSTILAAISRPFFQVDFQRVYQKGTTASAGITQGLSEDLWIYSGATASGGNRVIFASSDGHYMFGSEGIGFNRMNWDKAGSLAIIFRLAAKTTNGEINIAIGSKAQSATTFGYTSSDKCIGVRIADDTLYGMVSDGTTLSESISTGITLTSGTGGGANAYNYELIVAWDGNGNVEWFLDGAQVASVSSPTEPVPSGISTRKHPEITVANNADAANVQIDVGNLIFR